MATRRDATDDDAARVTAAELLHCGLWPAPDVVVLELAADETMAIKPAGQTTGAAAAAGYSAGYGLPIEEERENETGGAMQCKREAGGALARRKKIKAKG